MSRIARLRAYARLGLANIVRVGLYRVAVRSGLHPAQRLRATLSGGVFLRAPDAMRPVAPPNTAWDDAIWRFGWHREPLPSTPPDWFANPFSPLPQPDATQDWWRIPDFGAGDIKGLWELSRFDWVVAWATKAAHGDDAALERLNLWLSDWIAANPPYRGPNWKCGQEASIRVMHLVAATWLLGQDRRPERAMTALIAAHLQRIAPTMSYAIGQANNHGTSEAAALLLGGSMLDLEDPRAAGWAHVGRRWLEERALALIGPDGSFSQHSVTYHRLMLDTYALVEAWCRHRRLSLFSPPVQARLATATRWLEAMTDPQTGDAANLGANDGARLLQLTGGDYRDFRPSVQLAAALFEERDAYGPGEWNAPLRWLGVAEGRRGASPRSTTFDDGGYHVLRAGGTFAVMRYPRFRFRPSQADALHLDLWADGTNLLRDAGSYSYNADGAEWFSGTSAHNTVEFDGRDQMPRLGRFLFGDWLETEGVEPVARQGDVETAAAAYTDRYGCRHLRQVRLGPVSMTCQDTLSGPFREARLRWRLAPGPWRLEGTAITDGRRAIRVEVDGTPVPPMLGTTAESRYYQQRVEVPLVSVRVDSPCRILTKVTF